MTKGEYLRRAAQCEEVAALVVSEEARDAILKLAERWRAWAAASELPSVASPKGK